MLLLTGCFQFITRSEQGIVGNFPGSYMFLLLYLVSCKGTSVAPFLILDPLPSSLRRHDAKKMIFYRYLLTITAGKLLTPWD